MRKAGLMIKVLPCCLAVLLLTVAAVQADMSVLENLQDFGHLSQNNSSLPTGFNSAGCGPTALTNSLLYLQNEYSGIYGTSLVPDPTKLVPTAKMLVGYPSGTNYLNWDSSSGVTWNNYFRGTYNYVEHQASGKTIYQGEVNSGSSFPSWVSVHTGYPTWNFLYSQLQQSRAVMIFWEDSTTNPVNKHYMSLAGMSFTDSNTNGHWDVGEAATITYIDPKDGATYSNIAISQNSNGLLQFTYHNNVHDWYDGDAQIVMAESFGPVPLPSTLLLLGSGLLGLAGVRSRFKKS